MLEDRKFYFPITPEYQPYRSLRESAFPVVGASPWQIVGSSEAVSMNTNKPFVGRHTPMVQAGTAIRQNDLGVTQGKEYVGYAWLKSASDKAAAIDAALIWGDSESAQQVEQLNRIGDNYRRFTFKYKAGATTDKAGFELRVREGTVLVGTVS
jgi:alpha-N-arabinofuranosidase